jgi:hypothetical protein
VAPKLRQHIDNQLEPCRHNRPVQFQRGVFTASGW